MCTIYTVDKMFYDSYEAELSDRIMADFTRNHHGLVLVGLDPDDARADLMIKSFNPDLILMFLDDFMTTCGPNGRIWLHQRAATSSDVHVGTMHGFNDREGNILMHNGILWRTPTNLYAVDSFAIPDLALTQTASTLLASLERLGETFANVFVIRPQTMSYSVVRCKSGMLFTDGEGNYSSYPVGSIRFEVPQSYAEDYFMARVAYEKEIV